MTFSSLLSIRSHPVRVRGLKPMRYKGRTLLKTVAPRAGAWIETLIVRSCACVISSHPVRVRGLKPLKSLTLTSALVSHPVRVRGLKPVFSMMQPLPICRTPCGCVD